MPRDTQPLFAPKTLLILGCGYLGTHVAREALGRGLRVTALTRNASHAAALRTLGAAVICADLAADEWHAAAPRHADYVLNCTSSGAANAPAAADPLAARRHSYLEGMRSTMRWLSLPETRVGTLVYTSSTGVYPQGDGLTVTEDSPAVPPDTGNRAGILAAAEHALQHDCPPALARWFILRLAGLYGPGRTHLLEQVRQAQAATAHSALPPPALQSGLPRPAPASPPPAEPPLPTAHLNLIHVADAAAAIWAAFAAPPALANRIYNVADDAPTPKRDVLAWLASQLKPDTSLRDREPTDNASLAAPTPAVPNRPRRAVPDRLISNARLKCELGWRPRYPDYRSGYAKILSQSAPAAAS